MTNQPYTHIDELRSQLKNVNHDIISLHLVKVSGQSDQNLVRYGQKDFNVLHNPAQRV